MMEACCGNCLWYHDKFNHRFGLCTHTEVITKPTDFCNDYSEDIDEQEAME